MHCTPFLPTFPHLQPSPFGGVLATAACLSLASPGQAEGCRLALVLALDVSGSVSVAENRFQREGLAAALLAPEVRRAFLSGDTVAVYVFEWAGDQSQAALVPGWMMVQSEADLVTLVGILLQDGNPGLRGGKSSINGTAVGSALLHAAAMLALGPVCEARTVDVSGDGVNSEGMEPRDVIATHYDGITVNALIIDRPFDDPMLQIQYGGDLELADWFETDVVHGPGAFHILADGYADYELAMTAKLLRELQSVLTSGLPDERGGA